MAQITKDLKKLMRRIEEAGWRVEDRGKSWACYSPDGETIVFVHKTPSDHRVMRNTLADLKRGGYDPDADA